MQCGSLERHRILRGVYAAIPDASLAAARCLQFSPDIAAPRERFRSFEVSVFGGDNSLDITRIDRPDASYDWVIANHVIEHVKDDRAALAEMARIAGPTGIVQVTVPTPATALTTIEFAEALPERSGHWRAYGSDWPASLTPAARLHTLQATGIDGPTGAWDFVYCLSRDRQRLLGLGSDLIASGVPATFWG